MLSFKTRKMREEEREQKLSAYQTVIVRIVFPDRTWLQVRPHSSGLFRWRALTFRQGKFSSQETFSDIYNFVRQALVQKERLPLQSLPLPRPHHPSRAFYLFMTPPPKRIEDSSSTQLKYSQLLPAARILFAWNEAKSEPGEHASALSSSSRAAGLDCSYMSFAYVSKIEESEVPQMSFCLVGNLKICSRSRARRRGWTWKEEEGRLR